MHEFVSKLYDGGIVSDGSVDEYIEKTKIRDNFIKTILSACGLTRKIIDFDQD